MPIGSTAFSGWSGCVQETIQPYSQHNAIDAVYALLGRAEIYPSIMVMSIAALTLEIVLRHSDDRLCVTKRRDG